VIEEIKAAIHAAANANQKTAMFHLQVLTHADELMGIDPRGFCKEVSVSEAYATEFTKMIALARLMKEQGVTFQGYQTKRAGSFQTKVNIDLPKPTTNE
jgi:hypothetical protein